MTEKRQCAKKVWHPSGNWGYHTDCKINAVNEEEGKLWCKTHTPSLVLAKGEATTAQWRAKWASDSAASAKQAELKRLRNAVVDAAKVWSDTAYGDDLEYTVEAALLDALQALRDLESAT